MIFNIPARTLALGPTTIEGPISVSVNTIKAVFDFSSWVTGTLDYEIFLSFNNGASWESQEKAAGMTPPPWRIFGGGTTTNMLCNIDFGKDANGNPIIVHPTNVRVTTTVSGNPIPLGNSTVTLA